MTAEQRVVSGAVWEEFCDALKQAGAQVLRPEAPDDALSRAEGWRYLSRLLRIGLEMHLEFANPEFPGFFLPSHETGKIGADNPDNQYAFAKISGALEYLIRGTRGSVSYLSFGSQKGGYETNGRMEQTGFLDGDALMLDADGRFEILLSQIRPASGNWLPLEPESNAVIVRQTFRNRADERPAQLQIVRRNAGAAPAPLTPEQLEQGLKKATAFVNGTATLFANWAQSYLPHSNQLPAANQALCQSVGGDPNIVYHHSHWALQADEALVIDVAKVPDCRFWNVQVNNWWMESLDYRYHRICINQHSAVLNAEGGVRVVIAHTNPGVANWLETAGHFSGTLCLRWVGAAAPVQPTTRVMKLKDLTPP